MRYIVADIHGCYHQYQMLLEKIQFSEKNELYVLGDAVDRGPEPIKVLQDMMKRPNVIFILGNHDFIMYTFMKKLSVEITEDNYDKHLTTDLLLDYNLWLHEGGRVTAEQFRELSYFEKMDVLDYIAGASLYEVIENNGREYLFGDGTYADCFYRRLGENESIYEKRAYSLGLCLCRGRKTGGILYRDGRGYLCGWTLRI